MCVLFCQGPKQFVYSINKLKKENNEKDVLATLLLSITHYLLLAVYRNIYATIILSILSNDVSFKSEAKLCTFCSLMNLRVFFVHMNVSFYFWFNFTLIFFLPNFH